MWVLSKRSGLVLTIEARPGGPAVDQYAFALARSCRYRLDRIDPAVSPVVK
jgi:hypothetical protein